ncbi:MAG: TetR/AcrR family transcriptional regulator [Dehalococcoidia bacterium]|nr:MAG: TetR/AcrR family transcriptional regulator [Dehalococcoidia bacterium]
MTFGKATAIRQSADSRHRRHFGFNATRDAIMSTARAIMREDGVGALNLSEIARRMGMKTPSLYTYFDGKHALYDALFREGWRAYAARTRALAERHGATLGVLEAAIEDYMRFADENPDLYALMFERPVPGFVPSPESIAEAAALLEELYARMGGLIDAGAVRSGLDAHETSELFLAVMHGLTALKRANEPNAAIGTGRFGSLVPAAARLLRAAWQGDETGGGRP